MSNFSQKVYEIVKVIPKGKVTTYAQLASMAGLPKAFRAVGQVLKKNPTPIKIPCHRVIASGVGLGGYVAGLETKAKLLKEEGIEIKNGKVDLKKYGWV